MSMTSSLTVLQARFVAGLVQVRNTIEHAFSRLLADRGNRELAQELRVEIRGLIGAGSTFGIPLLTEQARTVDIWLAAATQGAGTERPQLFAKLEQAVSELCELLAELESPPLLDLPHMRVATCGEVYVLVVDPSGDLRNQIGGYLTHFGFKVTQVSLAEFSPGQLAVLAPAVVLADVALITEHGNALREFANSPAGSHCTYMFMAADDDFDVRLAAVRAGGAAFFRNPVDVFRLVDAIDRVCRNTDVEPWRVLIADESPVLAEFSSALLGNHGIVTEIAAAPVQLLETVDDFQPDVVVLDVHLHDHSGIELARLLRQRAEWVDLPIVFLSVEPDIDAELLSLGYSDDDFLPKPIIPGQLVKSVQSRCLRSRAKRGIGRRDNLTGLLLHSDFYEQLERAVARAGRDQSSFSVCLIDIDDLQRINDDHGHRSGDHVLRTLSLLLTHRTRRGEIVGRFGGDEIALLLPDCGPSRAQVLIDEIRMSFGKVLYQFDEQWLSLSFSGGISGFREGVTAAQLIADAHTALASARDGGGDRVVAHGHRSAV